MKVAKKASTGSTGAKRAGAKPKNVTQETDIAVGLIRDIGSFLDEKKMKDIVAMDLRNINSYLDYFLIATATSFTHLKAGARELQKQFGSRMPEKKGSKREDEIDSGWVIFDFSGTIVHLFVEEQRRYYNLEKLWGDAKPVVWQKGP